MNTLIICITIIICWLSTLALVAFYIRQGRGVSVRKTTEIAV
jgi:hypothetical protein